MPDSPKIKHGSSHREGGRRISFAADLRRLGIPTDPVLVISPVPRTPSKGSQRTGRRLSGAEFLNLVRAASPPAILEDKDFQRPRED